MYAEKTEGQYGHKHRAKVRTRHHTTATVETVETIVFSAIETASLWGLLAKRQLSSLTGNVLMAGVLSALTHDNIV